MLTHLRNAFVDALDAYTDAYFETPSSPSPACCTETTLRTAESLGMLPGITDSKQTAVDTGNPLAQSGTPTDTIPRGTYESLMRIKDQLDCQSHVIIPKGNYDAFMELLSLYKYASDHDKVRKQKLTALDDTRNRINLLLIDVNNARYQVENSGLYTMHGMMKTLERHVEVLESAKQTAEGQPTKFIQSEQKLADIRDAMTDSIALRHGVAARLPLRLSRLGSDFIVDESPLSAQATDMINRDLDEIFRAIKSQPDDHPAEQARSHKLQQQDLLESLDICRNEMDTTRTIIDNTKKVEHAQNREQSLKQLRLHQEQLIDRMRALADELIIRGVPCALDAGFDDWLEEFNEVDAEAEIKPKSPETSSQIPVQLQIPEHPETDPAFTQSEAEVEDEDDNDIESDASDIVDEIPEQRRNSEVGSPRGKS